MMTFKFISPTRLLTLAALSASLLLSACGGGSSGDAAAPDSPSNPTPTNPTPTNPTPTPTTPNHNTAQTALQAATQYLNEIDKQRDSIPTVANATTYFANEDSCYLSDGRSKAFNIANTDGDLAAFRARNAFQVGSRRSNIQITGDEVTANPDGSTRRRVSFSYLITYADGSTDSTRDTIISGSSQGTCASSTDTKNWRVLGNQRIAEVSLRSRNEYRETLDRTTGADINTRFSREVQMFVNDPANIADYAIVSAPTLISLNGGGRATLTYKLLSPRILRSAPELAGKRGNITNAGERDAFSICLIGTNGSYGLANTADCVGSGANGTGLSRNLTIPAGSPSLALNDQRILDADAAFNSTWGFSQGLTFTFALYKDDGWKTVNGQAGKTPVVTYTAVLNALPYTFLELNNGGDNGYFRYPLFDEGRLNGATAAGTSLAAAVANGAGTYAVTLRGALAPTAPNNFRLSSASQYFEGPESTNAAGVIWPLQTFDYPIYPGGNATAVSFNILPKPDAISGKTFSQFVWTYTDRDIGRQIRSRLTLQ